MGSEWSRQPCQLHTYVLSFREELYYEPVSASYTKCPLDQLIADVGRGT